MTHPQPAHPVEPQQPLPQWAPPPHPNAMGQWGQPGVPQWQQPVSERAEALPVEPRPYHHFWRAPRWRWWKMLVALVLALVVFLGAQVLAMIAAILVDDASGRVAAEKALEELQRGEINVTPAFFAANNVALAALIPVSMLLAWWFTGQRPQWLSSVVGGIRWGWLGRCFAMLLPLWLVWTGIQWFMVIRSDEPLDLHVNPDTWFLIGAILLTTPLQAAGEEYGFRGLLNRLGASFFAHRGIALAVGALVSSLAFMAAHGAGDPWLNGFYLTFGVVACVMTWRTGGLEAAIAMHVINNVLSMATLPFSDISGMFDREAGAAGPEILLLVLVQLIGLALVEWQARRRGIVRESAPAAPRELAIGV